MATLVSQDLVVPEGDVRTYIQNDDRGLVAALLFAESAPTYHQPSLINFGEMRFQTDQFPTYSQTFLYFATASFWNNAQVRNYGLINAVVPDSDYVKALYAPSWSPDLDNAGAILAEARLQAIGYESWDSSLTITNHATGLISATAQERAFALYLANGGTVTNAGEIIATATGGTSSVASASAISLPNGRASIVNSGLIQATDNSANDYATAISFYGAHGETVTIVNSGTIRGDYAIRESNPNQYAARAFIENSGLIQGIVDLADGNDVVRNSGQIFGDANLGAHHDVYDGRQGTIAGIVRGGDGNDLLIGGAGGDTLHGDAGNDALFGGGGDTLTGGAGDDLFVFTTVTPGAPDEVITDFTSGRDRIDLRALSPTSVTINGSTITAATAGGPLTIRVTGSVTSADILTGPTGSVTGTAGMDLLLAGPGGAMLSAGDGADLLVGGTGNDRLDGGRGDAIGHVADLMAGGAGDDTYVVDDFRDLVIESSDAGYDTIEISPSLSGQSMVRMPDHVERMIGASAYGNALDNMMVGSSGADRLVGVGGADTIVGGDGNDEITGGSGADVLTGGGGADFFLGTIAELSGDTIADLGAGDRIWISDADAANFTFSLDGNTLSFTGGSLTLANVPARSIMLQTDPAYTGVILAILPPDPRNDFNGDGRSDIMWRHDDGTTSNWLSSASGGFAGNGIDSSHGPSPAVRLVGSGEFGGGVRDDLLWRDSGGTLSIWFSSSAGGWPAFNPDPYAGASAGGPTRLVVAQVALSWTVAGIGDFNGDARDDILWRHDSGMLTNWLGQGGGAFTANANAFNQVDIKWQVAGSGDYNGDGRSDILWRHDSGALTAWLGQSNGGFVAASALAQADKSWRIVGSGDFNGDGRDDVLWRHGSGALTDWLGQTNGGFVGNANAFNQVDRSWHVAAIGDYNGDGRDDLIWRHDNGAVTEWLGRADGGFVGNAANVSVSVSPGWQIQSPDILLI